MEDDGPNTASGSPDRSGEDGIEPDFKAEDKKNNKERETYI